MGLYCSFAMSVQERSGGSQAPFISLWSYLLLLNLWCCNKDMWTEAQWGRRVQKKAIHHREFTFDKHAKTIQLEVKRVACQGTLNTEMIVSKNQSRELPLPNFKMYYKVLAGQTVRCWQRDRHTALGNPGTCDQTTLTRYQVQPMRKDGSQHVN